MKDTREREKILHNNIALWGSVFTLIFLSYLWRLKILNVFPFGYDEGIHLILGKLWAAGYTPYEEIFVSYPPFFLWSLGIPWKIFNQASALQLVMATYALTGVIAVIYLGSAYHSHLAGIGAGILLSFTPAYFIPSISIMGEVPSIGIAVVSIALAEKYRRSGSWGWVLLAGIVLAFGLSLKILPFYAVPFVGLMVVSRHIRHRTSYLRDLQVSKWVLLRDLIILAGGFLAVLLLPVLFLNSSALYEQVVGMRLVSRDAALNPFDSNHKDIIDFIFTQPSLTALAIYGFVFVVARKLSHYWLFVAWFILVLISMYFHVPLRGKHLPIFLPILAIFAGFAIAHILDFLKQVRKQKMSPRSIAILFAIFVILGMFGWEVPHIVAKNNGESFVVKENTERLNAINFIDKIAMPDDCVIADNPVFLYNTHRLPSPELSETSQTRIDTGYLTLQDVVQSIQAYNCHVVAIVTPRFGESIPGLPEWLADHYLGLYAQGETFVYFAKKGADNIYIPLQNRRFGELVQLYGLRLSDQPWQKEEAGFISLFWQLDALIQGDYIEQITLRNSISDEQAYQLTRMPFEGEFNPVAWHTGERVRDTFRLDLPPNLAVGTYDLYLSLCLPETGLCLPVDNVSDQTELYLGRITVQN